VCGSPLSRFRDLLPPEAWATVHDSACASGITASEISKHTRPKWKVNVPRMGLTQLISGETRGGKEKARHARRCAARAE
jgi:hypothetical protein